MSLKSHSMNLTSREKSGYHGLVLTVNSSFGGPV